MRAWLLLSDQGGMVRETLSVCLTLVHGRVLFTGFYIENSG